MFLEPQSHLGRRQAESTAGMQETKVVIEINANMGIEIKDLVSLCLLVGILI